MVEGVWIGRPDNRARLRTFGLLAGLALEKLQLVENFR